MALRWRWLLLSLVFSAPVWAEEPKTYPEQGVQTFKGLDDTSAPTQVEDGRAQDLQNVQLDVSQSLRKRYGTSLVGNTMDVGGVSFCSVTGLAYMKFSSGTERIISTCGQFFYYLNGTSWSLVTGPTLSGVATDQFVWANALDNLIGTDNAGKPIQYDGSTVQYVNFSSLTSTSRPTAAKTVAFFKNYLVFGNTVENGTRYATRIRWSNVGSITTWSDNDYIDIGSLAGQEVVAMAELYDNLYLFLTDSIYKVSLVGGADTYQISKVTQDIGAIAKNSVQSVTLTNAQNGLIFLDKKKRVYFFNGVIAQDITTLITQTMGGLSGTRLQYAVSADTGTDYYLCVTNSTGSTNDLCLDFQYQIGEWTKHTNLPANAMAHVLDANTTDQVYFGSYASFVYQLQNTANRDDVGTATGTLSAVSTYATSTTSSQQVLYDSSKSWTVAAFNGAPLHLIGGTGADQTGTIIYNTATGLVMAASFTTTPASGTTYEVGAIDSFYTTKWYDFGLGARLKRYGEVYFWADADVSSTHSLSYATDFSTDIETLSLSLSSSTTDALWGSAIWGTALWGDVDTIFRQAKMTPPNGRYLRLKWSEDDPAEDFHIFGYNIIYWPTSVN